ncbi:MAG: hypothetical protein ACRD96_26910 [Bryobacteraceae bacterium]
MRSLWILALAAAWAAEEKQEIRRSFASARRIEVDNVSGGIRVAGHDSSTVELVATQTIQADTADDLARARQEVKLDISEPEGVVRLYVDGPFRCDCGGSRRGRRGYSVRYDFELRAPRGAFYALSTVNQGDIRVEGLDGDYDVENINGGIEMVEVGGSGRVHGLNRPVKVLFKKNPRSNSSFGSLNGEIELVFLPGLSADFRIKTFNGKIYTDFPMTALAPLAPVAARRDGKFVFRTDRHSGVRVGQGGPEIKIDGFNGTIRILERKP